LQNEICDFEIDVSKYKKYFKYVGGPYKGRYWFECNSGKSCYAFDVILIVPGMNKKRYRNMKV
jgi:hypothetical protein